MANSRGNGLLQQRPAEPDGWRCGVAVPSTAAPQSSLLLTVLLLRDGVLGVAHGHHDGFVHEPAPWRTIGNMVARSL